MEKLNQYIIDELNIGCLRKNLNLPFIKLLNSSIVYFRQKTFLPFIKIFNIISIIFDIELCHF